MHAKRPQDNSDRVKQNKYRGNCEEMLGGNKKVPKAIVHAGPSLLAEAVDTVVFKKGK